MRTCGIIPRAIAFVAKQSRNAGTAGHSYVTDAVARSGPLNHGSTRECSRRSEAATTSLCVARPSSALKPQASAVEVGWVSEDQLAVTDVSPPAAVRPAGQHARATQRRLAKRTIVKVAVVVSGLVLTIALLGFGWVTSAIEVGVVLCLVLIDRTASSLVERWGRGAAGEELVGQVLEGLRERGWLALHDVQLGRGNIDHVLVGPAGIYTIETKSHRGRLRAAAVDSRMLKQAYAEAKLIERMTGLRVDPLLVFSNAYLTPAVTRCDGVVILPARMLAGHLQRRGGTIPPERVNDVYRRLAAALPG